MGFREFTGGETEAELLLLTPPTSATPPCGLPGDGLKGGGSGSRFHRWLEAGINLQMAYQIILPGAGGGGWFCHRVLEETGHQAMVQGQGQVLDRVGPQVISWGPCTLLSLITQADLGPSM